MSPLQFEAAHRAQWDAFAAQLGDARAGRPVDGAALAAQYRRVCEQLALAQARAYPIHLTARLETLAQQAHQLIYRRQDYGLRQLGRLLRQRLPRAVREQRGVVLLSALLFLLPGLFCFGLSLAGPEFALHVASAAELRQFEAMYADGNKAFGRMREAGSDWMMFGFYIFNNVGIGFRSFGAGLLGGVGSAVMLVFNGVQIGTVAGHLTRVGLGHNFWPFVATHSAFELTGLVLSGAGGLRLGFAWLAPGRRSRLESLRHAAQGAVGLIYAAFFLLVVAAVFEAFWSSAPWIAAEVKFGVAALCWVIVAAWLGLAGRGHAD